MRQNPVQREWSVATAWLGLLAVLAGTVYRDTLVHVVDAWNKWASGEYFAHGYLVLLICLFLVLRQRRVLGAIMPCPAVAGLPMLAAGSLLWLSGYLADVFLVEVSALLPMLLALLWVVLGTQLARRLFLPVFIMVFALPVWSMLPDVLQRLTAEGSFILSRLLGVPAMLHGQIVILPEGRLHVAQECSGVSYLLAALTLGTLYGYLYRRGFGARLLVITIAGAAGLLANILRVTVVIYFGWRSHMQHPVITDHFNLGWYLFGAIVVLLVVMDGLFARNAMGMITVPPPGARDCAVRPALRRLLPVLAGLLLVSGPLLGWLVDQRPLEVDAAVELPAGTAGWDGPGPATDSWMPVFRGAVTRTAVYRNDDASVLVFIGYYPRQEQGRELIYYSNDITGGMVWMRPDMPARKRLAGDRAVLEQQLYTRDGRKRMVWYWYRVAGRDTTSRFAAKAWQLLGLLQGRPQAGVVVLAADIDESADAARERLGVFVHQMGSGLSRSLDGRVIQKGTAIQ